METQDRVSFVLGETLQQQNDMFSWLHNLIFEEIISRIISAYFLYVLCMMDSLLVQHLLGLVISSMVQGRARLIIHFLITNLYWLYSSVIKYNCSNIRCKMTNYT